MKPSAALEGGPKVLAGGNGTTPFASVDGRHALGRVIETVESMKRASGQDSHPFDCMTYGAAVPLPNYERHVRRPPSRPERKTPPGPLAWMSV